MKKTYIIGFLVVLFSLAGGWYLNEFEDDMEGREPPSTGRFSDPEACTVNSEGRLFVMDQDFAAVQAFDREGTFLFSFGGNKDGVVPGLFHGAEELVFQTDDRCIVLEEGRLQAFDADGHFLGVVVEREGSPIDHPEEIAVDEEGAIYITNEDVKTIVRYTPDFSEYTSFSVPHEPEGIDAGPDGRIWVAFSKADYVGVYKPDGTLDFTFGTTGSGKKEFNIPDAMIISSDYEVFVTDQKNNRIQVFDQSGNWKRMFGKKGSGPGEFHQPEDIQIGPGGHLYVADKENSRIQVLKKDGTFVREIK